MLCVGIYQKGNIKINTSAGWNKRKTTDQSQQKPNLFREHDLCPRHHVWHSHASFKLKQRSPTENWADSRQSSYSMCWSMQTAAKKSTDTRVKRLIKDIISVSLNKTKNDVKVKRSPGFFLTRGFKERRFIPQCTAPVTSWSANNKKAF